MLYQTSLFKNNYIFGNNLYFMSLKEYNKKRDLEKTKEPKPVIIKANSKISKKAKIKSSKKSTSKKSNQLIYMIHEHHASHLHWDLRLEMGGVLKSWAVPKTPSTDKEIKRLAIQVEDHPIEYATFKGIIPEGNYGAGEVKIWDTGTYEIIEQTKTKLTINISGKKLKGKYYLIKTNYGNKKNNWLFFRGI